MSKEIRTERRDDLFKDYVIARIEKAGEKFEVLVKPDAVVRIRDGKDVDVLRPLIPIRFEKARIAVRLTGEDAAKSYGDIKAFGTILKEEWLPNGAWVGVVEMPAGMQTEFLNRLNAKTKGNVEAKVLKADQRI